MASSKNRPALVVGVLGLLIGLPAGLLALGELLENGDEPVPDAPPDSTEDDGTSRRAPDVKVDLEATLKYGHLVDLDTGDLEPESPDSDVFYGAHTEDEEYFRTWNGEIGLYGQAVSFDWNACAQSDFSSEPIELEPEDLPESSAVCVRTNEGRISRVIIKKWEFGPGRNPNFDALNLVVAITTWEFAE